LLQQIKFDILCWFCALRWQTKGSAKTSFICHGIL